MGGGLMQLVAYGAQDIYLTGNPQITFFKVVYRRHTNFSMEAIEQTINGTVNKSARLTSIISRNGDLIYRVYHELTSLPTTGLFNIGAKLFDTIELEIGGQKIDRITGKWMEVWAELTESNSGGLTGQADDTKGTTFQNMSCMGGVNAATSSLKQALVPLPFWFCRNPGLALPLIALQYHEVKLITTLSDDATATNPAIRTWVDYIYLDTDERRRFAQVSHEYLIEQLQYFSDKKTTFELNFNHPVKELIWTASQTASGALGDFRFGNNGLENVKFQLKLNGHDRFAARTANYFTRTQVWEHHTGPGGLDASGGTGTTGNLNDTIAVYSFALKPEEHQPSGTCNFSRIDNAQLVVTGDTNPVADELTIYAINYNVLRIMSGMGGLAYSN
jgi:hypothetical protein